MSFDSPVYVAEYRGRGQYPRIHQAIFNFALAHVAGRSVLDLCASTGLLGRHFADIGWRACAVEASERSIAGGVYGPGHDVLGLRIEQRRLGRLVAFMRSHGVDAVIARRCVYLLVGVPGLAEALYRGGAREVVLQGLVRGPRLAHVSLDGEIAHLASRFEPIERAWPELAYLRAYNRVDSSTPMW